jgi:hypothetical protein
MASFVAGLSCSVLVRAACSFRVLRMSWHGAEKRVMQTILVPVRERSGCEGWLYHSFRPTFPDGALNPMFHAGERFQFNRAGMEE